MSGATVTITTHQAGVAQSWVPHGEPSHGVTARAKAIVGVAAIVLMMMASWALVTSNASPSSAAPVSADDVTPEIIDALVIERSAT